MSLGLGEPAPAFALPVVGGGRVSMESLADRDAVLVVFSCNHCPYVLAWEDRLNDLARDYGARGVGVVAICANDAARYPVDSFPNMERHAAEKGFVFDYAHDESQEVARAYGATRTPEAFLLDVGAPRGLPRGDRRLDGSRRRSAELPARRARGAAGRRGAAAAQRRPRWAARSSGAEGRGPSARVVGDPPVAPVPVQQGLAVADPGLQDAADEDGVVPAGRRVLARADQPRVDIVQQRRVERAEPVLEPGELVAALAREVVGESCWSWPRKWTAKPGALTSASCWVLEWATQTRMSGGSRESEAKAEAVIPAGPSGPAAVTTVTPLAHRDMASRKISPATWGVGSSAGAARSIDIVANPSGPPGGPG